MAEESANRLTTRERLQELYRRLGSSPKAISAEAAFCELCEMLEQVENELSGIEKGESIPGPWIDDGRMYRPLEDHVARQSDGSILALTRGHRIEVSANGSIRIISKLTGQVEFAK